MAERVSVSLTIPEYTYFAKLLGADALVGIGDPFLGWLTEEIEGLWATAHNSLVEKGIIEEREGGGITADTVASALVSTCAWPSATVFVSKQPRRGQRDFVTVHIGERLAVEHKVPDGIKDEISLKMHEGLDSLKGRIWDILDIKNPSTNPDITVSVPSSDFSGALFAEESVMVEVLSRQKNGDPAIQMLEDTMSSDYAYSALLGIQIVHDRWQLEGMGYIYNSELTWRVVPNFTGEDGSLALNTTNYESAKKDTYSLIEGMLS